MPEIYLYIIYIYYNTYKFINKGRRPSQSARGKLYFCIPYPLTPEYRIQYTVYYKRRRYLRETRAVFTRKPGKAVSQQMYAQK